MGKRKAGKDPLQTEHEQAVQWFKAECKPGGSLRNIIQEIEEFATYWLREAQIAVKREPALNDSQKKDLLIHLQECIQEISDSVPGKF